MNVDEATDVLDYWLCLELLSPQKLQDASPRQNIWHATSDRDLPWIDPRKMSRLDSLRKGKEWRHIVTFGIIDLHSLMARLKTIFALKDQEGDDDLGRLSYTATLTIETDGRGHAIGSASFSSLPWAMSRLIAACPSGKIDFSGFSGQGEFEDTVKNALHDHLVNEQILEPKVDKRGRPGRGQRPLNFSDLRKLEQLLFDKSGWHPGSLLQATVCTKGYRVHPKRVRKADSDILNSFHIPDMLRIRSALKMAGGRGWSNVGAGLSSYLNGVDPATRIDVRREGIEQVFGTTMPAMMPLARWPSKHPLAFAQQFAVNRIMRDLDGSAGLFSVNGPPGTGKTTLLRDIVAAVVFRRAEALARLKTPADGFGSRSAVRNTNEQYVWPLHPSLGGFGMVVASSNNGAVENISKELPTTKSIDAPGVSIDYFAAVADGLIADKSASRREEGAAWGLIAAILGNRENCGRFVRRFWGERAGSSEDDEVPEPDAHDPNEAALDRGEQQNDKVPENSQEEGEPVDINITLQHTATRGAEEQDSGFIGFSTDLDNVAVKPWADAVSDFLLATKRVRLATEAAQRQAQALNSLTRAQHALPDAEARHTAAASKLAQEDARYNATVARLAVKAQEFDAAITQRALAAELHEAQARLASVKRAQPAKSAE